MFSSEEETYLTSQRIGRLATVAADGQPDADAVSYQWNGHEIVFFGHNLLATRKARNIAAGADRVSFIVDDIGERDGARYPRGLKIHGLAEIRTDGERPEIAIRPVTSWSWGLLGVTFANGAPQFHKIVWPKSTTG
jgi:pyridoxamine 5'-phosphate oxidase family protein